MLGGTVTYRFVHAADIHLDWPLRSLALGHSELAELIGNATRRAFVRMIDLCLDEQPDALLRRRSLRWRSDLHEDGPLPGQANAAPLSGWHSRLHHPR